MSRGVHEPKSWGCLKNMLRVGQRHRGKFWYSQGQRNWNSFSEGKGYFEASCKCWQLCSGSSAAVPAVFLSHALPKSSDSGAPGAPGPPWDIQNKSVPSTSTDTVDRHNHTWQTFRGAISRVNHTGFDGMSLFISPSCFHHSRVLFDRCSGLFPLKDLSKHGQIIISVALLNILTVCGHQPCLGTAVGSGTTSYDETV